VAGNNVDLTINVDTKGAVSGIDKVESSADNLNKTLEKTSKAKLDIDTSKINASLESVSSKIKLVGTAVIAAFSVGAIKGFFDTIIDEAVDAENNMNLLSGALSRAGLAGTEAAANMSKFASEMMNLSTIDDDVINGQLGIALNFTKNAETAQKLVSAAANLSAAMKIDLGTAVEILGKSLDGTAGKLSETIPEIRGLSKEALIAGGAIDLVAKKFAGAAENELNTFAGAMSKLRNVTGNFFASLGSAITQSPVMVQLIKEIGNAFSYLTGEVEKSKDGHISFVNNGIITLINGIRSLIPFLNTIASTFKAVGYAVEFLVKSFMNLMDAIRALEMGFKGILTLGTDLSKISFKQMSEAIDRIAKRSDELAIGFKDVFKDTFKIDEKAINASLDRIVNAASKKPIPIDITPAIDVSDLQDKISDVTEKESKTEKKERSKKEREPTDKPENPKTWQEILTESIAEGFMYGVDWMIREFQDLKNPLFEKSWKAVKNDPIERGLSQEGKFTAYDIGEKIGSVVTKIADNTKSAFSEGINKVATTAVNAVITNIAKGSEGAKAAISDTMGAVGGVVDKIFGTGNAFGSMIKGFFDTLSSGEKLKEFIDAFIKAIPDIIQAIISNIPILINGIVEALPVILQGILDMIPVLFQALAEGLPKIFITLAEYLPKIIISIAENIPIIIEALAENLDVIIIALMEALPDVIAALARALVNVIVILITKAIPNIIDGIMTGLVGWIGRFFDGLGFYLQSIWSRLWGWVSEIGSAFKGFFSSDMLTKFGQALRDIIFKPFEDIAAWFNRMFGGAKKVSVKKIFGMAEGGVVPQGYPNDKYPAMLTSGEMVVRPKTTDSLFSLIDNLAYGGNQNQNNASGNAETNSLLRELINLIANQQKEISIYLDKNQLAKAILSLNQDNRRLA
jgi:hypothetical protein